MNAIGYKAISTLRADGFDFDFIIEKYKPGVICSDIFKVNLPFPPEHRRKGEKIDDISTTIIDTKSRKVTYISTGIKIKINIQQYLEEKCLVNNKNLKMFLPFQVPTFANQGLKRKMPSEVTDTSGNSDLKKITTEEDRWKEGNSSIKKRRTMAASGPKQQLTASSSRHHLLNRNDLEEEESELNPDVQLVSKSGKLSSRKANVDAKLHNDHIDVPCHQNSTKNSQEVCQRYYAQFIKAVEEKNSGLAKKCIQALISNPSYVEHLTAAECFKVGNFLLNCKGDTEQVDVCFQKYLVSQSSGGWSVFKVKAYQTCAYYYFYHRQDGEKAKMLLNCILNSSHYKLLTVNSLYILASIYAKEAKWEEEHKVLLDIITREGVSCKAKAHNDLALLFENKLVASPDMDYILKAVEHLKSAIQINSKMRLAYYNLGRIYENHPTLGIDSREWAKEYYTIGSELDDGYCSYNLGVMLLQELKEDKKLNAGEKEEKIQKIITLFLKAKNAAYDPLVGEASLELGKIYYRRGEKIEAEKYLNIACESEEKAKKWLGLLKNEK